jgi:hypothetical protein
MQVRPVSLRRLRIAADLGCRRPKSVALLLSEGRFGIQHLPAARALSQLSEGSDAGHGRKGAARDAAPGIGWRIVIPGQGAISGS